MKKINIPLRKNQFLSKEIKTNCIFYKNVTGIGATHSEIFIAKRNSIIIEPNVPVIIGKSKGNELVIGVYEGVTREQVKRYLQNDTIKYKKIVCTPESFITKVVGAFNDLNIDAKNDYFMLIDECEKLIKDANYRDKILAPLEHFFEYKNKAFVSATPIMPSDPRFKKQGFKVYNVIPKYKIAKDLNLITTNHTITSLDNTLKASKAKKVFIFLNSITGSADLIKTLKIEKQSSIFMSTDGVKKFRIENRNVKPAHISDDIQSNKFSKYNFLTSRYFSAVDINIEEDIDIVMISDPSQFEWSILDPYSDVVQIVGRFRKSEFIKNISLITNTTSSIIFVKQEDIEKIFEFGVKIRDFFQDLSVITNDPVQVTFLNDIVNLINDQVFFNKDYTPNYFMMDNYREENRVKSLYKDNDTLLESFENLTLYQTDIKYFNVKHTPENYITDKINKSMISARTPFRDKLENLIEIMEFIEDEKKSKNMYVLSDLSEIESILHRDYLKIYEVFLNEGPEKLRELRSQRRINNYYYLNMENSHLQNFPLLKAIYNAVPEGKSYLQSELLDKVYNLCIKFNVEHVRRDLNLIKRFFIFEQTRNNRKRYLYISGYKFNINKDF